jgi:hypothetical protein
LIIMTCRFTGSHTRPSSIKKTAIPRYKPLMMHQFSSYGGGEAYLSNRTESGC